MKKWVVFAVVVLVGVCVATDAMAKCGKCGPKKKGKAPACSTATCGCPFGQAIAGLKLNAKQQAKVDAACARFKKNIEKILTPEQLKQFDAKCSAAAAPKAKCAVSAKKGKAAAPCCPSAAKKKKK